eukprot:10834161-Alexandrium_andersonii.AAC.1
MHVERLLPEVKRATDKTLPAVERLLGAGTLTQWIHRHVHKHHGSDPRVVTRHQLLSRGTPLRSLAKPKTGRGGMQPCLAFANAEVRRLAKRTRLTGALRLQ